MKKLYDLDELLDSLPSISKKRKSVTVSELCDQPLNATNLLICRFDVERDPSHAVAVGRSFEQRGIPGTFYFHTRKNVYDPEAMKRLSDMGHEVGYHMECLDRCAGDFVAARDLFLKDVERFRQDGIPIETASYHGEAGLPKDGYKSNQDLFRHYPDLTKEAGLKGDAFTLLFEGRDMLYISDVFSEYLSLRSLLRKIGSSSASVSITVHPHRWRNQLGTSLLEITQDLKQHIYNRVMKTRSYETIWDD